jgi:hypothetical protein
MSLSELTDPEAVRQAIAEFDRMGRAAFLQRYGFGKARDYLLRESGRSYDSKAIVGAAFGYQFPDRGPLKSADFNGGENTVQRKLEDLGFTVERIGETWSRPEVERTVGDYLDMLALEARGAPFNKSAHNNDLRRYLNGRSKASVELKHQNISAVLHELGLPFIRGYKPRSNVQELLREVVVQSIRQRQNDLARVLDDYEAVHAPSGPDYRAVLVEPPAPAAIAPGPTQRLRLPRKLDHAARDESNRALGRAGESWSLGYERFRLGQNQRHDLASRIDWVADTQGDGAGYDIASFDDDGAACYIEVKTTNGGAATPFVVTSNELAFSIEAGPAFRLYRLFTFSSAPHLFILRGALTEALALTPMNYRARVRAV